MKLSTEEKARRAADSRARQLAGLTPNTPLPAGISTQTIRIRGTTDALTAFRALSAAERGEIIEAWFSRQELK